jgi:pimeloyl-ACP methyl ester carboxylesterase
MSSSVDPQDGCFRAGTGTPVVLLHGVSMSWRIWKPVLPLLTAHHDVFVPTLAGHRGGPLPSPDQSPGMSALVDLLCDQLDRAGIDTPHVVGNSLGGWVALELARRGRARSVTAISPAGAWRSPRDLTQLLWMFKLAHMSMGTPAMAMLARYPRLQSGSLRRLMAHPGRIPADEMVELIADFAQCPLFGALASGAAKLHQIEELDIAHCPVHIAWAEKDRLIPYRRFGHPMRARVRGAEFSTLPGLGHVPMYDDPQLIARIILEMTTRVDELAAPAKTAKRPRRTATAQRACNAG